MLYNWYRRGIGQGRNGSGQGDCGHEKPPCNGKKKKILLDVAYTSQKTICRERKLAIHLHGGYGHFVPLGR